MTLTYIIFILKFVNQVFLKFIIVFNPVKNKNTGELSETKKPRAVYLPNQDVSVRFLNKLQEANEFLKQT